MLVMFWEDYYHNNPIDAKRTPSGEVFFSTGDPLIDKWEREISMGIEPDLLEGLSPEQREKEQKALTRLLVRKGKMQLAEEEIGDGFEEDYSSMLAELPVLGSGVPYSKDDSDGG